MGMEIREKHLKPFAHNKQCAFLAAEGGVWGGLDGTAQDWSESVRISASLRGRASVFHKGMGCTN